MDPNKALKLMVEAFARGDRDDGLDKLDGLRDWLMSGGFVPDKAATELIGENPRILIKVYDVPAGVDFCKQHGSTWYRRIGQEQVLRFMETGHDKIYGVTDYGNVTHVAPEKRVWVRPPLDWKLYENWCELMTKYMGYDPEDDRTSK